MAPIGFHQLVAVVLGALFCVIGSAASVPGQVAMATLSGVAVDDTGGAIPDVQVVVANVATGLQRQLSSDAHGAFTFPLLPPGRYSLTAQRDGFAAAHVNELVLNVGAEIAIRLQMKVAPVGESVTVTEDPALTSTSPAASTVIDRQFVENLPLNGRSFQTLITLAPGVVIAPATNNSPGQFSVNGQRTNANYFMVDGVSANVGLNPNAGTPGQQLAGTVPAVTVSGGTNGLVSVDALEEFRIETSTYAGEFGRQPGGQVSLLTRSGTNRFAGSAFEYFRDESLDANDWFNNRSNIHKTDFRQHQFGGVLGGPLKRDRTFFFASYEGLDLRLPVTRDVTIPSMRVRQIAADVIKPYLNAFPVPTGVESLAGGLPSGVAPLTVTYSDPQSFTAAAVRLDHAVGPSQRLVARVAYSPSETKTRRSTAPSTPLWIEATAAWRCALNICDAAAQIGRRIRRARKYSANTIESGRWLEAGKSRSSLTCP